MEKPEVRAPVSDKLIETAGGMETVGFIVESVKRGIEIGVVVCSWEEKVVEMKLVVEMRQEMDKVQ